MTTKKFWCHYIGRDGNTPKRRSIELTNLAELIPTIGDNEHCATPLWYEEDKDSYGQVYYYLYAQLSDKVATYAACINLHSMEFAQKTEEQMDAECEQRLREYFAEYPNMKEEYKQREREYRRKVNESNKEYRRQCMAKLRGFQDYFGYLIGGGWTMACTVCAFEDADSPYLPVVKELRRQGMAMREEEDRKRREQHRKEAEEEAKRKAEEEAKEQERLTQEAVKFKNGESISGDDVVDLCRRYGINVHLRTVHNLHQVVTEINGKKGRCSYRQYGKRSPKLDGCFKTAEQLYNYLQTHEAA